MFEERERERKRGRQRELLCLASSINSFQLHIFRWESFIDTRQQFTPHTCHAKITFGINLPVVAKRHKIFDFAYCPPADCEEMFFQWKRIPWACKDLIQRFDFETTQKQTRATQLLMTIIFSYTDTCGAKCWTWVALEDYIYLFAINKSIIRNPIAKRSRDVTIICCPWIVTLVLLVIQAQYDFWRVFLFLSHQTFSSGHIYFVSSVTQSLTTLGQTLG